MRVAHSGWPLRAIYKNGRMQLIPTESFSVLMIIVRQLVRNHDCLSRDYVTEKHR